MRNRILQLLSDIEEQHRVKVIYACEAGSRASGLASSKSDYDVRFIYIHPVREYLSIEQKRDVIEVPFDLELDIVGWDIKKALHLLKKSNPSLSEWLQSSIVYTEHCSSANDLRALANKMFSAKACLFHYLSIAKRNVTGSFQESSIIVKKLINVVKPLLACKWIEKYNSMPPNEIQVLLKQIVSDDVIYSEIEQLINDKRSRIQQIPINRVETLHQFIKKEMEQLNNYTKRLEQNGERSYDELDHYFQNVLKQIWGNNW